MRNLKTFIQDFGWPRIIIFLFLIALFVFAPAVGVRLDASVSDVFNRFGQYAILVLAMVPMIQSGCGLNFGLALGIIAGLLGSTISLQLELRGFVGFFGAIALATPFSLLFGWLYGKLLNKVKGEEMTIAMYVGFSFVMLMCIMWLVLPFNNPTMVWGYAGKGLRTTITVEGYWLHILNDFLAIKIGRFFIFPTGLLLFVGFCAFCMWVFLKSRTGTAMTAVGIQPRLRAAPPAFRSTTCGRSPSSSRPSWGPWASSSTSRASASSSSTPRRARWCSPPWRPS